MKRKLIGIGIVFGWLVILYGMAVQIIDAVPKFTWWYAPERQFTVTGWDEKHFFLTHHGVEYKLSRAFGEVLITPEMVGTSLPTHKSDGILYAELENSGTVIHVYFTDSTTNKTASEYYLIDSAR
jgi:hypothetical protein